MEARAKLVGHPIHQMLIVFPLGLLATAIIFDLIYLITQNALWTEIAYWMITAGIIGGFAAAIFGLIDWLAIPAGTRAKRIGALHGLGNLVVVLLFVASWFLRVDSSLSPSAPALVCSFAGVALALFTGWLGGELVAQHAVGVNDGASLNAPSSIHRPARETEPVVRPR